MWVLAKASSIISYDNPSIFISTWIAVIPFLVPATLKSISPKKSSISINARVDPHTLPWEVDPFELNTSDTTLIVYGNSSWDGITGSRARSARAPCPISLLPGPRDALASPTEYGGIL